MKKTSKKKNIRTLTGISICLFLLIVAAQSERVEELRTDAPTIIPEQVNQVLPIPPGYYEVVEINDGDTITVDMNGVSEKVRFIGVDTPEKDHPKKPVQCFAQAATDFTKQLLSNKPVRLEADPINQNRDRYNRLLRYVYLEDGTLVNQKIIEEGFGFAYLNFPFTKADDFATSETIARDEGRGLWNSCSIETDGGYISTNPAN